MIQIGEKNPSSLDAGPIDHLFACHRRIEECLRILERAAEHFEISPAEALRAINNSLQFLDTSGMLHTRDEEESLFPRLTGRVNAEESAYLSQLEQQHRRVEELYQELKETAIALANDAGVAEEYQRTVESLAFAYREHIQSEDERLLDIARRVLSEPELSAMQSEMRARRALR